MLFPPPPRAPSARPSPPAALPLSPPPLRAALQVDQLFSRVQEHDDAIIRLDATLEKNAVRARVHPLRPLTLACAAPRRPRAPPLPRSHPHPPILPQQAIADDSLKAVQASLKASLASLRDEMNRKLQALTVEIAQLQKQMNVARGEQSIMAQQQKDTSKRVDILSSTVSELSAEIVGDEAAPSVAAVQGAAF